MNRRILVTGGRNFADRATLYAALDDLLPAAVLIYGCATGADELARRWAVDRRVPTDPHPANWDDIDAPGARIRINKRGKPYNAMAGFQRNGEMLRIGMPTHVVAFDGGNGTADMIAKTQAAIRRGAEIEFVDHRTRGLVPPPPVRRRSHHVSTFR